MPDLFALTRSWWRDFAVALTFLTRAPLLVRETDAADGDLGLYTSVQAQIEAAVPIAVEVAV